MSEQLVDAAGTGDLGIRIDRQPGHEDEVPLRGPGVREVSTSSLLTTSPYAMRSRSRVRSPQRSRRSRPWRVSIACRKARSTEGASRVVTSATAFRYAGASASGPSGLHRDGLDGRGRPHGVDERQALQVGERGIQGRSAVAQVRAQRDHRADLRPLRGGDVGREPFGEAAVHERARFLRKSTRPASRVGS